MYVDKIREIYPHLSPGFTRVADFLIDHYTEAAFMTATELARTLDVDAATIVRFAQRLGYLGFPQLQGEIRELVKADLLALRKAQPKSEAAQDVMAAALEQIETNITRLRQSLDPQSVRQLVAWMASGRPIYVLAYTPMISVAKLLRDFMDVCHIKVQVVDGDLVNVARWATTVNADDTVIAIELSPVLPSLERAISLARGRQAHTVALVTQASMSVTRHTDLVFVAPGDNLTRFPSHAAIGAFVSALAQTLISAANLDFDAQSEQTLRAIEYLTEHSNGGSSRKTPLLAS